MRETDRKGRKRKTETHTERHKDDRKTDEGREENRKQDTERKDLRQMALLCSESHPHLPAGQGTSSTSRVTLPRPHSGNALGYRLWTEVDLGSKPVYDNG